VPSSELRTSTPKTPFYGLFWHFHSFEHTHHNTLTHLKTFRTTANLASSIGHFTTEKHFHKSPHFAYSTYSINFLIHHQASTFFRASGFLDEFFRLVEVKGSP